MSFEKPDLIVGVDFGMTCTGVAYANLTRGETVKWIAKWPHRAQANENKVPTVVVYPKGSPEPSSWGFGSEEKAEKDDTTKEYREWFKTFLDPAVLQDAQRRDSAYAPSSQDHVDKWYEDYLRLLYQHIEFKLGSELPAYKPWDRARIEFIFSLPTTWQPYPTVEKFRAIVERAGYGQYPTHSIALGLTEPEAAAVHTSSDAPGMFQESEVALICDAGGGTTDFSLLRIVGTFKGTLTLRQLGIVAGKNIGSVHIDRQFVNLCRARLQQAIEVLEVEIDVDETAWSMMKTREFQNVKCDFGSPDTTPRFSVPIPDIPPSVTSQEHNITKGCMTFTSGELQAMFDSQIQRLFTEIDKQLQSFEQSSSNDTISHLVLSGGLGNSAYVQNRLRERYALGRSSFACARDIQIHVAPDPQLAVCKGLVVDRVRKLQTGKAILGWRCARASYGTRCKIPYDKDNPEHHNKALVKDGINGKYYIEEAIAWFIKKGEPFNVDVPIIHRFSRRVLPGETSMAATTGIIFSHLEKNLLPLQVNKDAQVLCEVESNFSSADPTKFKKKNRHFWNAGKAYQRIDYEIRTVVGPADLRFELWFDGQKMNRDHPIKVEWQPVSAPHKRADENAVLMDVPKPPAFSFSNRSKVGLVTAPLR